VPSGSAPWVARLTFERQQHDYTQRHGDHQHLGAARAVHELLLPDISWSVPVRDVFLGGGQPTAP
jgi:hypothetical protein